MNLYNLLLLYTSLHKQLSLRLSRINGITVKRIGIQFKQTIRNSACEVIVGRNTNAVVNKPETKQEPKQCKQTSSSEFIMRLNVIALVRRKRFGNTVFTA